MRFAEIVSTRAMIVVGALSVGTLIAATWECSKPARAHEPRAVTPMRGCGQARVRPAPPPVVAPVQRNGYADTLIAARDSLSACMTNQKVSVRLSLDISPAGRVTNVMVKANTDDVSQLDMHVVKCLNTAVSPLQFPRGSEGTMLSTHLGATR